MKTLFILLAAYQLKHWLCDYPLQRPYMLEKSKGGAEWILPLALHAWVHGAGTFVICAAYGFWKPGPLAAVDVHLAAAMFALDFAVHFVVDRAKAAPTWG